RFIIRTDAQQHRASRLERRVLVPEIARLFGAAGRVILRIEIERDGAPPQVGKAYRGAVAVARLELRRGLSFLQHASSPPGTAPPVRPSMMNVGCRRADTRPGSSDRLTSCAPSLPPGPRGSARGCEHLFVFYACFCYNTGAVGSAQALGPGAPNGGGGPATG